MRFSHISRTNKVKSHLRHENTISRAIKLHNAGYSPEEIAEEIGVARATAYRWVNQHQTSLALAGAAEEDEEYQEEIEVYEEKSARS